MIELPGLDNPPARLKIFAPNGEVEEFVGWIAIKQQGTSSVLDLCLLREDGQIEKLNKKVVVYNTEAGEILYSPRQAPTNLGGRISFLTKAEKKWLRENPSWPAVLELEDEPVGEDGDGIRSR